MFFKRLKTSNLFSHAIFIGKGKQYFCPKQDVLQCLKNKSSQWFSLNNIFD